MYDSMLLFVPASHTDEWISVLKRNFTRRAALCFKYLRQEPLDSQFTFCGVRLQVTSKGIRWTLEESSVLFWKNIAKSRITATPRALFALLGFLRFAFTIVKADKVSLGRASKFQSKLGYITIWDEQTLSLTPQMDFLAQLIGRIECDWNHPKIHLHIPCERVVQIAVDATPFRWAFTRS